MLNSELWNHKIIVEKCFECNNRVEKFVCKHCNSDSCYYDYKCECNS